MRLMGGINVPCGCEARKEVMFTHGALGVTEGAILAVAALSVIAAVIYRKALTT